MIPLLQAGLWLASLPLLLSPSTGVTVLEDRDLEYQREPQILGHDAPRVGELVMDVEFEAVGKGPTSLRAAAGEKGLMVVMRDPECPLSKKYSPRLRTLAGEAQSMGLGVLFVGMEDVEVAKADVELYGFEFDYGVDPKGLVARELDARTSTEVFLIDPANTLVYRGMVDDQHGLGFSKPAAESHYLVDALESLRDGKPVRVPATEAQGCKLQIEAAERAPREITYHNRISRIVQRRCESCHRTGESGPFALSEYGQVNKRRSMIEWALEDHIMPPWYAEESGGPWANNTSLTTAEREDFLTWIAAKGPEGDPEDAPLARSWVEGWGIGEPDLVVTFEEPFHVPAEGVVDYQYIFVKTDLPEDRWVEAIEIRSSAPQVVHHALVFLESPEYYETLLENPRDREANRNFQGGSDSYFASAVPGQAGLEFLPGTGKLLPAGSWIKFQMHYTPNGAEAFDSTSVGFRFADEPLVEVKTNSAINETFAIPPGAFDYEVSGEFRFPEAGTLLSFFPHTHLRGNRFVCELIYPDGDGEVVLELPFYDFNWQMNYQLLKPLQVPAGTRLRATAWYDNSEDNPANPDPSSTVRFGEQTWEEMMIAYVNWVPTRARVIEASSPGGARGGQ